MPYFQQAACTVVKLRIQSLSADPEHLTQACSGAYCRQAVNNTMQKFGLKTTKSKRARRETEAEEEAEAALQFKVVLCSDLAHC